MSYLGRSAKLSLKAQEKVSFLATAGQTSKTGLSYTPSFIEVYVNGVLLTDTTDFTATNGNSITFTVALLLNDEVTVISLKTFTVADHYTKSDADTLLAAKATNTALALKAPIASPVFTGNVGIGVTPESDWSGAGYQALQIGAGSVIQAGKASGFNYTAVGTNFSGNGNVYLHTDKAVMHKMYNGEHKFQVAPSGTADAAISWTTPLTITNDGRGLSEFTAKAWCKWAANTTSSNVTYGHNVSSVAYVSQGRWRVNFTNSLTYNYSAQMMCMDNGGRNTTFRNGEFEQAYCGVYITNMSQTATTSAVACFTAFGE